MLKKSMDCKRSSAFSLRKSLDLKLTSSCIIRTSKHESELNLMKIAYYEESGKMSVVEQEKPKI